MRMTGVQSGYHSLFFSEDIRLLNSEISDVIYFPRSHPTQTATVLNLFARGFKSEKGMSSTEISPTRASLAAESAAGLPLMPTWPGTHKKQNKTKTKNNLLPISSQIYIILKCVLK